MKFSAKTVAITCVGYVFNTCCLVNYCTLTARLDQQEAHCINLYCLTTFIAPHTWHVTQVYGSAREPLGNVIGCMRSNANTPCPSQSPIPYIMQAPPATAGGLPTFPITQCRPAPAVCGVNNIINGTAYNIWLRTAFGASNDTASGVGCLVAGATSCPPTAPFFLLGTSATAPVDECRQLPVNNAPTLAGGCSSFLLFSAYTIPLQSLTNALLLAGCASPRFAACPAGYVTQYSGKAFAGCQVSTDCTTAPYTRLILNGTVGQIGCGDATSCAAWLPDRRIPLKDANGAAEIGCMPADVTECPAVLAIAGDATSPYSIYGSSNGRVPLLSECWRRADTGVACGTGNHPTAANVPLYDTYTRTNKVSFMVGVVRRMLGGC
jgi:hypothetical protein